MIPALGGAANWPSPSFDPETGLFYVNASSSYSLFYLTDTDEKPEGYGGRDSGVYATLSLKAIDYRTGQIRWTHDYNAWRRIHRHPDHGRKALIHRRSLRELHRL